MDVADDVDVDEVPHFFGELFRLTCTVGCQFLFEIEAQNYSQIADTVVLVEWGNKACVGNDVV